MKNTAHTKRGFTLIEVLVSVSIFAIVMLIATGAVFSIVEANKKTHSLKSVMTNLNFALESMARDMRVGFHYTCNGSIECANGGTVFKYKANRVVDGRDPQAIPYDPTDGVHDYIEYTLENDRLMKQVYGTGPIADLGAIPITAAEIHILSMKFYLIGGDPSDGKQPKVLITIGGYAGSDQTRSDFNIQTTVSQRSIDS
jgi:prepilin-type N-terminal cleavage/methylation domain-containing protein